LSSVKFGPVENRVRIHSGLRSIGVSALRASSRSNLRPSGCTEPVAVTTTRVPAGRGPVATSR